MSAAAGETRTPSAEAAWAEIAEQCRRSRPDSALAGALAFIRPVEVREGELVLEAQGNTIYELVRRGFGRYIETRAQQLGLRGALLRRAERSTVDDDR